MTDLKSSGIQGELFQHSSEICDNLLRLSAIDSTIMLPMVVPYNDLVRTVTSFAQGPVRLRTTRDGSGFDVYPINIDQETRLLSLTTIGDIQVAVRRRYRARGRIIISDRYLPTDAIRASLSDQGVTHVKRCGFRRDTQFIPKETVIVTLDAGLVLPQHLRMGNDIFNVLPYTTQAPQCYKCGRTGHVAKYCFSRTTKCYRCGGPHLKRECTSVHPVCQLCRGSHETRICRKNCISRNVSKITASVVDASISVLPADSKHSSVNQPTDQRVFDVSAASDDGAQARNTVSPDRNLDAGTQTDSDNESTTHSSRSSVLSTRDAMVTEDEDDLVRNEVLHKIRHKSIDASSQTIDASTQPGQALNERLPFAQQCTTTKTQEASIQTDVSSPYSTPAEDSQLRNTVADAVIYLLIGSCQDEKNYEEDMFRVAYSLLRQSNAWLNTSETLHDVKVKMMNAKQLDYREERIFDKQYAELKDECLSFDHLPNLSAL
jgi:hypothetical protein